MEKSFKLRAWTKADIPALAKHLNNKKACFKNGKFVDCHCYELVSLKKIN